MALSSIVLNTNTSTGASVAVDTTGSKAYQQIKLVDGTTGGTDGLPGSTADGLLVNLGSNNDVTITSGTITINSAGSIGVNDASSSLTIDNAALSVTGGGAEATALRVTIANDSTGLVSVDDNGNSLTVDGTVAISAVAGFISLQSTGTLDTNPSDRATRDNGKVDIAAFDVALPSGTNNIGDVDILSIAAGNNNIGDVDIASIAAGDNNIGNVDIVSGTITTVSTVTTVSAVTAITNALPTGTLTIGSTGSIGTVPHDGVDSTSPVKIGFKAESSPKGITLVADGDRTDGYADLDGLQMVKIGTANADLINEAISDTGGSSTAFTQFSAVANTKNYVCGYSAFRTDAGTSLAYIDLRNGTAGAVIWRIPLPPNGGSNLASAIPICSTSANTALAYDVSTNLTTVYLSVFGFQSKA